MTNTRSISVVAAAKVGKGRGRLVVARPFSNRDDCKLFWLDAATTEIDAFCSRFTWSIRLSSSDCGLVGASNLDAGLGGGPPPYSFRLLASQHR